MEKTSPSGTPTPKLRKILPAAALGHFVEFYDFLIFAYIATTIGHLFFPSSDPLASSLQTFGVFALGFTTRPLGGLVFSHLGDRWGRRNVLAAVIAVMGLATTGIGLLPTYENIGVAAPILLTLLRMIQGFSAGAESTGSNTFVAEHSPAHRRGFIVSISSTFINLPGIFAATLVLVLTQTMGMEAFQAGGWRLCFLLGGLFSLIGLVIRFSVPESPEFVATTRREKLPAYPVLESIRTHPKSIAMAFALSVLAGLSFYMLSSYMSTYLTTSVKLDPRAALASNAIALGVLFITQPFAGLLSDVVGRGRILTLGAFSVAATAYPAYLLVNLGGFLPAVLGQVLLALGTSLYVGPFTSALLEPFPTRIRFSAAALAFNLAYVLFAGTAPLLSTLLVSTTQNPLSPAIYLTIVAALVGLACLRFKPRGPTRAPSDLAHHEAVNA